MRCKGYGKNITSLFLLSLSSSRIRKQRTGQKPKSKEKKIMQCSELPSFGSLKHPFLSLHWSQSHTFFYQYKCCLNCKEAQIYPGSPRRVTIICSNSAGKLHTQTSKVVQIECIEGPRKEEAMVVLFLICNPVSGSRGKRSENKILRRYLLSQVICSNNKTQGTITEYLRREIWK